MTTSKDTFTLFSTELGGSLSQKQEYDKMGGKGENQSPQLAWKNAPQGTKSYALTVHDPDAPTPSGWWHWTIFNLPATAEELPANAGDPTAGVLEEQVVQAKNDYGEYGFGGALPPVGDAAHAYVFTLYALDTEKIEADKDVSSALLISQIREHILGKASIVAYYKREK